MSRNRYNSYGALDECSISEDIDALAAQINRYIHDKNGYASYTDTELRDQLIGYLRVKKQHPNADIRPSKTPERPTDWTKEAEELWLDWIANTFVSWEWIDDVITPVFGTDVRSWEGMVGNWREEVWHFLPYWVARSWDAVEETDPCGGIPEETSDDEDERYGK